MDMLEARVKAATFDSPEFIPVAVGILPAAWMKYRDELEDIVSRHPVIFGEHKKGDQDYDEVGGRYTSGEHVDPWGCVWSNIREGMDSIVTGHPVPTRESVHTLKAPKEDMGFPHGFMFLRLTDLRGFNEAMIDFAEEPPELQMLIDIVLEYNLRQVKKLLAETEGQPFVYFGDDLGMQDSLPISPEKWRQYLKPCFAQIYAPVREAGHLVYMHTDGHIIEIIPDLIDCGVNVVNPQFRANGLDNLAAVAKGKICIDLDLDRQMFPFCTPADIDAQIEESVRRLGAREGGLWVKAEVGPDVSLENIEAICASLEKHMHYFA